MLFTRILFKALTHILKTHILTYYNIFNLGTKHLLTQIKQQKNVNICTLNIKHRIIIWVLQNKYKNLSCININLIFLYKYKICHYVLNLILLLNLRYLFIYINEIFIIKNEISLAKNICFIEHFVF